MKHLLLFAVLGVGALLAFAMLQQRKPTVASVPVNPFQDTLLGIGDGALGLDRNLDTGSGWYEYWRGTMAAVAQKFGTMDPAGPILCITSPCPGTPTPTSP